MNKGYDGGPCLADDKGVCHGPHPCPCRQRGDARMEAAKNQLLNRLLKLLFITLIIVLCLNFF